MQLVEFNITTIITSTLIAIFVIFVSLRVRNKWRLYYLALKINGPLWVPFLGSISYAIGRNKGTLTRFLEYNDLYGPVFKIWIGTGLFIFVSEPNILEIVLKNFPEKSDIYDAIFPKFMKNGLISASASVWKEHRKIINPSFNTTIINSFEEIFARRSQILVEDFKNNADQEIDFLEKIWKRSLEMSLETIADVDPNLAKDQETMISNIIRSEAITAIRFKHPLLVFDLFFRFSSLNRCKLAIETMFSNSLQNIITLKTHLNRKHPPTSFENDEKSGRFLNRLMDTNTNISKEDLLAEFGSMLVASSETIAILVSSVMLCLGIYSDVQEKLYDELYSIFGDGDRDVTLEDLKTMNYLDCVIKETMRLIPPIPLQARILDKEVKTGSYVLPAGANVVLQTVLLHTDPLQWPDPWKFDPDRFSEENSAQRHRCSFLPFSYGPRECIGMKYGMISAKIMLSTILRAYRIKCGKYKSIREIPFTFFVVTKPEDGFKGRLERRT